MCTYSFFFHVRMPDRAMSEVFLCGIEKERESER